MAGWEEWLLGKAVVTHRVSQGHQKADICRDPLILLQVLESHRSGSWDEPSGPVRRDFIQTVTEVSTVLQGKQSLGHWWVER